MKRAFDRTVHLPLRLAAQMLRVAGRARVVKKMLETVEKQQEIFITYHCRPANAEAVKTRSDDAAVDPRLAIVIQGPFIEEGRFTLETVKLYRKHFPRCPIVLSVWDGPCRAGVEQSRQLGAHVLRNTQPEYAGVSNINLQIVSSRNGVLKARQLGAEYVLKTRTDQRIYAPNVAEYLLNLIEVFPLSVESPLQRKRIVGVSLNSFKYRMYGLSDMLLFGHIDDMWLYWNADLDQRVFTPDEVARESSTLRRFARWNVCEVYLATGFLAKVGHNVQWTLRDSWRAFAERFCIVDKEQLDLFWPKYNRLEYRWLSYGEKISKQEMNFREWLNLYRGWSDRHVPEEVLEQAP